LLLANLLAAHAIRFKLSWKRSGIFLIHAGLIVMMMSELITGLYAIEGTMSLVEGERVNFVDDSRVKELAVIKRTGPMTEEVVAIPESMLRKGEVIRHPSLPFEIVVKQYMLNSLVGAVDRAPAGTPNPATKGDGLKQVAVERPEVSGADTEQKIDLASAYLQFRDRDSGKDRGTYLVSMWFYGNLFNRQLPDRPQKVQRDDGTEYEVFLRPKRTYRPFSIYLVEFRHDRHPGIDKPKNFSSLVRVNDPTENETREVLISMNDPLRYGGETFYQHGVMPGDGGTILQVVRNPGWLMPYISCVMVGVGMLIHFGLHLIGFLRKRAAL
jgi:hypothetical protein